MSSRLQIAVVTPLFPTRGEPYRGAPIWRTLAALERLADLIVYCPSPRHLLRLQPRSFRHHDLGVDAGAYAIPAHTLEYPAIPLLSRPVNGAVIRHSLRKHLSGRKPDLILAYWVHPDGYAAVRLGREMKIPVLVGSRGSDLNQEDRLTASQVKFTVRHAAGVLCVSSELARKALALGAVPHKVHTIRNGVDVATFQYRDQAGARAALAITGNEHWVLFVGWLSELKGVPQLVDAIAMLNRSGNTWHLALAGEGYLEQAMRTRSQELGIAERTHFLGPLQASQVADWMNACDFLCLPSRSEGCPNVVVEALSCGRPVVATAVGGIPELVDEDCAILIPSPDSELLATALDQAGRISWDRAAIARKQRRSWDRVAEETAAVCRQVAAGKNS